MNAMNVTRTQRDKPVLENIFGMHPKFQKIVNISFLYRIHLTTTSDAISLEQFNMGYFYISLPSVDTSRLPWLRRFLESGAQTKVAVKKKRYVEFECRMWWGEITGANGLSPFHFSDLNCSRKCRVVMKWIINSVIRRPSMTNVETNYTINIERRWEIIVSNKWKFYKVKGKRFHFLAETEAKFWSSRNTCPFFC